MSFLFDPDVAFNPLALLPIELLLEIIGLSLHSHPTPSAVLCLNSHIYALALPILYEEIRFTSVRGMDRFPDWVMEEEGEGIDTSRQKADKDTAIFRSRLAIPVRVKSIKVEKVNEYGVFDALMEVFKRISRWRMVTHEHRNNGDDVGSATSAEAIDEVEGPDGINNVERRRLRPVDLDTLSLCLHSHTRNPRLDGIYKALILVNPKQFVWTGPDPEHHFSTAIVPQATWYLFQAVSGWSNLTHLKLTNIAFPDHQLRIDMLLHRFPPPESDISCHSNSSTFFALPQNLKSIYVGQATCLSADLVARLVCFPEGFRRRGRSNDNDNEDEKGGLNEVRLVDVYKESIWGRRLRRDDVEKAVVEVVFPLLGEMCGDTGTGEDERELKRLEEAVMGRIRNVVRCEAKTERIMGGDRVGRVGVLE